MRSLAIEQLQGLVGRRNCPPFPSVSDGLNDRAWPGRELRRSGLRPPEFEFGATFRAGRTQRDADKKKRKPWPRQYFVAKAISRAPYKMSGANPKVNLGQWALEMTRA